MRRTAATDYAAIPKAGRCIPTAARVGGPQLAAALGAAANGASIEALIFGAPQGASTFDVILAPIRLLDPDEMLAARGKQQQVCRAAVADGTLKCSGT